MTEEIRYSTSAYHPFTRRSIDELEQENRYLKMRCSGHSTLDDCLTCRVSCVYKKTMAYRTKGEVLDE